mmetsp:Transcript_42029/g.64386  ORF Transcript_42029/g.64386 Transcript_42029/m.64386 type:complete len:251 (+) Transcript_42029:593-1345(+)
MNLELHRNVAEGNVVRIVIKEFLDLLCPVGLRPVGAPLRLLGKHRNYLLVDRLTESPVFTGVHPAGRLVSEVIISCRESCSTGGGDEIARELLVAREEVGIVKVERDNIVFAAVDDSPVLVVGGHHLVRVREDEVIVANVDPLVVLHDGLVGGVAFPAPPEELLQESSLEVEGDVSYQGNLRIAKLIITSDALLVFPYVVSLVSLHFEPLSLELGGVEVEVLGGRRLLAPGAVAEAPAGPSDGGEKRERK